MNIWHPYTQMQNAPLPKKIVSGKGVYIYTETGEAYLDAISSWWVNLHGHSEPYIAQKLYEQALNLEHVIFAGFTHTPAEVLAERLLGILPKNQNKIFYSDNGSTAVEVALKMAIQYWQNKNIPKKVIYAFENAYHGDTFGAMSISGRSAFTAAYNSYLFEVVHIPIPTAENIDALLIDFEEKLSANDGIAFIYEPLVQGAAGMCMYAPEALDKLLALCHKYEVLTIADEVMTGFGRTGKLFASEYMQHQPHIMCMSKGLTGGFMPMGVTSCSSAIYEAFLSTDTAKTFYHGHSYTANPLGCAVALASMDLLLKPSCISAIEAITTKNAEAVANFKNKYPAHTFRSCGTILAVEVHTQAQTSYFNQSIKQAAIDYFWQKNILIRPLGNILYFMPPYCLTPTEHQKLIDTMDGFLASLN